ncbi:MAG TPA: hypothetical protein VG406_24735 [Isosphaeraceae bacterium]|jgi:hypothetical protein|nr:hypothetical protein [Isosphaeraceae bacterium]
MSMIHNITAGHYDPVGVAEGRAVITKPINMRVVRKLLKQLGGVNAEGVPTLDGWKVRFEDGCVILPWLGGRTNRVSEEFAIRLQRATGCTLADVPNGRLIQPGQLQGLSRKEAAAG